MSSDHIPAHQLTLRQRLGRLWRRAKRHFRKTKADRFRSSLWQHGEDVSQRRYESYEDYLEHQRHKVSHRFDKLQASRAAAVAKFEAHFRSCPDLPAAPASVLCLAARIGSEVEAFINLGHFAVGIDLAPGPDNRHVVHGDFHHLVFADASVDVVFCNSLDHLFDLDRVAGEIARVLKPGGVAIIDIADGSEEGQVAGGYEATWWPSAEGFADKLAETAGLRRTALRSITEHGFPNKNSFTLIKSAAPGLSRQA